MYHLNESVKSIWALGYFKKTVIYTLIVFLSESLIADDVFSWPLPYLYPTIGIFIIGLLLTAILPGIRFKRWRFDVRPEELFLERGIFTHIKTTAPYVRIQHLDVRQSIVERYLKLATLVVYTAGTKGADIVIPGLPVGYAYDLRDALNNYTKEDEV